MSKYARQKWKKCLNASMLVFMVASMFYFRLPSLAYNWFQIAWLTPEACRVSLWLSGYQAVVQARKIEGVSRNLSGLTYNTGSGTLYATVNTPARVIELSTDGEVLRSMPIHGVSDVEGIAYISDNLYLISDERTGRLHYIEIPEGQKNGVDADNGLVLSARRIHPNLGVEALAWDREDRHVLVGFEKWPIRIQMIDQERFSSSPTGEIHEWQASGWSGLFISDLASIEKDRVSGNYFLLSDESAILTEYSPEGLPLGILPLWTGFNGLKRTIPQAEGLALAPGGEIFIVSEPNFFYRYEKKNAPSCGMRQGMTSALKV
ncbi:SdiA-regulated domain-containing protein [Delftia lacustris]|uniref:SdiA-regulated domain-containing protein n=1 Tax=Delftia lacustris TaxID=558537 RepID=UPI000A8DD6E1|nr:SdiA-regulated domain-containing protein [Delftia lacustris]